MSDFNTEIILSNESVTRYIFTKRHYCIEKKQLKWAAFIPPKNFPNEISVYRMSGLKDDDIWQLGVDFVQNAGIRDKPILARGDLKVDDIKQVSYDNEKQILNIVPEISRHLRHANIINLPQYNKGLLKIVAHKLAKISSLKLKNT